MTDIVGGLAKRCAELAGEASALRVQIARIVVDLGHLDAVIRQFEPECDIAAIRPKPLRRSDAARPGEMSDYVLGVLREAKGPLSTVEIAQRFMADRGIDADDSRGVQLATKRVGMTLSHQRARGTARSQALPGKIALWTVTG